MVVLLVGIGFNIPMTRCSGYDVVVDEEMDSRHVVLVGYTGPAEVKRSSHVVLIGDLVVVGSWSAFLGVAYVSSCLGDITCVATCVRCCCLCWRFFYQ